MDAPPRWTVLLSGHPWRLAGTIGGVGRLTRRRGGWALASESFEGLDDPLRVWRAATAILATVPDAGLRVASVSTRMSGPEGSGPVTYTPFSTRFVRDSA